MEDYEDEHPQEYYCECGKCRSCELDIALLNPIQPELLKAWVRKYELRKPRAPWIEVSAALPAVPYVSAYELTLTSTVDDPYYLRSSLKSIVDSAMFDIVNWESCIELTEAGLPHIHAILYSSRKYLDASKIKTKFKYRYELARVRDLDKYLKYIHKEYGNPDIVDYCKRKGIPQFDEHPKHPDQVV